MRNTAGARRASLVGFEVVELDERHAGAMRAHDDVALLGGCMRRASRAGCGRVRPGSRRGENIPSLRRASSMSDRSAWLRRWRSCRASLAPLCVRCCRYRLPMRPPLLCPLRASLIVGLSSSMTFAPVGSKSSTAPSRFRNRRPAFGSEQINVSVLSIANIVADLGPVRPTVEFYETESAPLTGPVFTPSGST